MVASSGWRIRMDDYSVFEYVSHSGNLVITSLRMVDNGKQTTLNFMAVTDEEAENYSYGPKQTLQKHPVMDNAEDYHRRNLD